jgi:hypothetical protein
METEISTFSKTQPPDIEAAPSVVRPKGASETTKAPGETETIVVLSFRELQLQMIGDLQDQLIDRSTSKDYRDPTHDSDVEGTLARYGKTLRIALADIPVNSILALSAGYSRL